MIPFVGAGLSAWCYHTWNSLLKDIVKENFPEDCIHIVEQAMNCDNKPQFKNEDQTIGSSTKAGESHSVFHWMEEIAECIFNQNSENSENKYELKNSVASMSHEDQCFYYLHKYLGEESRNKKQKAVRDLYRAFDAEKQEGRKLPEYQHLLHKLFPELLITTNYDKALERCYPSLLSYSYDDLDKEDVIVRVRDTTIQDNIAAECTREKSIDLQKENNPNTRNETEGEKHNWLFRTMLAKVDRMQALLDGEEPCLEDLSIPDNPMLLKVHGSIEKADNLALSRKGYDDAYRGEMPKLLKKLFVKSTFVFIGCSLVEDRILDILEEMKKEEKKGSAVIRHFALLKYDSEEEKENKRKERLKKCGIYPIYYYDSILEKYFKEEMESGENTHDFSLGLLLENLLRRKIYQPQSQEFLWDKYRYMNMDLPSFLRLDKKFGLMRGEPKYIRRKQALQIRGMLSDYGDCPLIAVTGKPGSGKSTLCDSIRDLQKKYMDTMQFFYISLSDCRNWEEVCIRVYQEMNILRLEIPLQKEWKEFAGLVAKRCGAFWRSVLILDHLDELKGSELWHTVKQILNYWKERQIRVIFICQDYPDGISCCTWNMEELSANEAIRVFFSSCTLKRTREISYLEKKAINELFFQQSFHPSCVYLMGDYARSKSDLTSLLEEWKLYHKKGEEGEQTLARILWNNLLDEHQYYECDVKQQQEIKHNIIWVWGILASYPGIFPSVFFDSAIKDYEDYRKESITEKTLIYMKNDGLCREEEEPNQAVLLENMKKCVEKYFFDKEWIEQNEQIKKWFGGFDRKLNRYDIEGGVECFRGYFMPEHVEDLRNYILEECPEYRDISKNPSRDIMKIMLLLSEKVKTSKERNMKENRKLNLILHYEIKTIIRFLMNFLAHDDMNPSDQNNILKVSCNLSHYFHYVPNSAFPLVRQLLKIIKDIDKDQEDFLCMQADLNCVMGDIQRLLGRKEEAAAYYHKSIELANHQMIRTFHENGPEYRKGLQRMAGALLISNYYGESLRNRKNEMLRAEQMYRRLVDHSGVAYSHQRIGEMLFASAEECNDVNQFREILKHYNIAAELFYQENEFTSYAYILKCMGDLAVTYRDYMNSEECCLRKNEIQGIKLEINSADKDSMKWSEIAAICYLEAFICYLSYINWRGLANVLQAMCTCYRTYNPNDKDYIETVENLYGLAEECYRWLGDIRGLADTLTYFGHGYAEYIKRRRGEEQNGKKKKEERRSIEEADKSVHKKYGFKTYGYMALSKWMESKEVWKQQGNETKVKQMKQLMKNLRETL